MLPDFKTSSTPGPTHEVIGKDDKNETKEICKWEKEDEDYDGDYDVSKEENYDKKEKCKEVEKERNYGHKDYDCRENHGHQREAFKKRENYHDRHHCIKKIFIKGKWYCVHEIHGKDWHDWNMEEIDWPEDDK